MNPAVGRSAASAVRAEAGAHRFWLAVLAALVAGALVAALGLLGPVQQVALVLALGLGVPAAVLFLARPHIALAAYLLVIPLLIARPIVAGLNGGELVTMGALVLGLASLWEARDRVAPTVRSLGLVVWPLLGLAAVSLLSLIANGITDFGEILGGLFKFLAFAGVAVLVYMHGTTAARTETMLRGALAGALLVAIYAVIAYVMGWSYSEQYDWNRASGTFEHWNALGGYMVLMSVTTLGMATLTRRAPVRLLLIAAFLLEITAMLLSLTLGSIVALVVGAVLGLVFVARIGWRRIVTAAALAAIGFAVVLIANPLLADKLTRFDERMGDRVRSYAVGVSMFRDKFLLGFGTQERMLDALWFGEADYGLTVFGESSSVPHNSLLMMGVEKGFLGLILFTLLIVGVLRLLFRYYPSLRESRYAVFYAALMIGVFGFLFQNLANNMVLHARIGIIFFALTALMVRLGELTRAERERSREGAT